MNLLLDLLWLLDLLDLDLRSLNTGLTRLYASWLGRGLKEEVHCAGVDAVGVLISLPHQDVLRQLNIFITTDELNEVIGVPGETTFFARSECWLAWLCSEANEGLTAHWYTYERAFRRIPCSASIHQSKYHNIRLPAQIYY